MSLKISEDTAKKYFSNCKKCGNELAVACGGMCYECYRKEYNKILKSRGEMIWKLKKRLIKYHRRRQKA